LKNNDKISFVLRLLQQQNTQVMLDATFKALPVYGYQLLTVMAPSQEQVCADCYKYYCTNVYHYMYF